MTQSTLSTAAAVANRLHSGNGATSHPSSCPPQTTERPPKDVKPQDYAVVVLRVDDKNWQPRGPICTPPLVASGLPYGLAKKVAIELNQISIASGKWTWHALVQQSGRRCGVARIHVHVQPDYRPSDPLALPPLVKEQGLLKGEARELSNRINCETLRLARVPKH